jgi:hypothetical protein
MPSFCMTGLGQLISPEQVKEAVASAVIIPGTRCSWGAESRRGEVCVEHEPKPLGQAVQSSPGKGLGIAF